MVRYIHTSSEFRYCGLLLGASIRLHTDVNIAFESPVRLDSQKNKNYSLCLQKLGWPSK
jgi:hypothetical protein